MLRAGLLLVGGFGLILFFMLLIDSLGGNLDTATFVFAIILELLLLLAAWIFGPYRYGGSIQALGFRAPLPGTASLPWLVLLASLFLASVYIAIVSAIGVGALEPPALPTEVVETNLDRLVMFVLVVLLAPLAEETFFRGFLLPVLVSRWGFLWGAGLTSLLFGVTHGDLGMIVPAFATGMLLAWLYYRTRSLWSCLLAHGAQNSLAFVLTFLL